MVGCVISFCYRFLDVPEDHGGCRERERVNLQAIQESPGVRTIRCFHGESSSEQRVTCSVQQVFGRSGAPRMMFLAKCGRLEGAKYVTDGQR